MNTRVLIADDHAVVREGARRLLADEEDIEVCAIAETGREALLKARRLKPNVAVLDLHIPDADGYEVVHQMRETLPKTALVVFTPDHSEQVIDKLFQLGVKSFIRKSEASKLLVSAVRSAGQQKTFFTPEVSDILFSRYVNGTAGRRRPPARELTKREHQTLRLIAEGRSSKQIASELRISIRTVESHRGALMRKLRLTTIADVVRYAIRNGVIEP